MTDIEDDIADDVPPPKKVKAEKAKPPRQSKRQSKRQQAIERARYKMATQGGELHDWLDPKHQNNGGGQGKWDYRSGNEQPGGEPDAEYQYDDQDRKPYLQVLRTKNPKKFLQRHWDGNQWQWGKPEGPKVPYFLPDLIEADPNELVWIAEGEKDTETLNGLGIVATTNSEGAGKWTDDLNHWFVGKQRVAICPDRDPPGAMHAQKVARSLSAAEGFDGEIRIVELPPMEKDPKHTDVTDWFTHYGGTKEKLLELYEAAPIYDAASAAPADDGPTLDPEIEAEFERLAALHPLEYERVRMDVAKRLKIRVPTLDVEVERRRPRRPDSDDKMQGQALRLPILEPWPDAVDGAGLLHDMVLAIKRFIVLSDQEAMAVALWVLHAHAIDHAEHSPRLNISSPLRNCGKSTLLTIIKLMTPMAMETESITTAALFRTIEMARPTLLMDEVDAFFLNKDNGDMRAILNAGYQRGGSVIRTVGDDHEPRSFGVWGAVALVGIGKIPSALESRCIGIHLRRRLTKTEPIERLTRQEKRHLNDLGRKAARWTADHADGLHDADPDLPESFSDREQNNWRPLIAIANLISQDWGDQAWAAAVGITQDSSFDDPSTAEMLLADVAAIFEEKGNPKSISSMVIVGRLIELAERQWATYRHGQPIDQNGLAKLLRTFGIRSKKARHSSSGDPLQGYFYAPIEDARKRFIERSDKDAVERPDEDAVDHPDKGGGTEKAPM